MPVALFALDAAHPRYKNLRYKKLRGEVKQKKQESRHNRTYKTENKRCKTKKKSTGSYRQGKTSKAFLRILKGSSLPRFHRLFH